MSILIGPIQFSRLSSSLAQYSHLYGPILPDTIQTSLPLCQFSLSTLPMRHHPAVSLPGTSAPPIVIVTLARSTSRISLIATTDPSLAVDDLGKPVNPALGQKHRLTPPLFWCSCPMRRSTSNKIHTASIRSSRI